MATLLEGLTQASISISIDVPLTERNLRMHCSWWKESVMATGATLVGVIRVDGHDELVTKCGKTQQPTAAAWCSWRSGSIAEGGRR